MHRRHFLAISAAGATLPGAAAARPRVARDVETFMRMFAAPSGEVCLLTEGMVYGKLGLEIARPLCGFVSLLSVRAEQPQPGVFRTEQREATIYVDSRSGELLTTFHNPYTDEAVVPFGYVTATNVYWFDGTGSYARDLPPKRSGDWDLIWRESDGQLRVTEGRRNVFPAGLSEAEFPRAYAGEQRVSIDNLTFEASLADLGSGARYTPARIAQLTDGPWQYWLMMGKRPGGVLWDGRGRKYRTIAEAPARIRAQVEVAYPGFTRDPWAMPQREFGTAATMRRLRAAGRL